MYTINNKNLQNDIKNPTEQQRGKDIPFTRLRRITGYLTSSLDTWNNAKLAEERDRVKHC